MQQGAGGPTAATLAHGGSSVPGGVGAGAQRMEVDFCPSHYLGRRAGREHLLAHRRGDVDQWRCLMAEGPLEGPLPAAARTALTEAAAALQAEMDVAQLEGVGCEGAPARVGCLG